MKLKAKHFDAGKPPLSLIPKAALDAEALVFLYGKEKYGTYNYRGGMQWTKLVNSALRHIYAFSEHEDLDHESKMSHIAHARCNLAMLLYYISENKGEDDRYNGEEESAERVGTHPKREQKTKERKQISKTRAKQKRKRSSKTRQSSGRGSR